MKKLAFIFLLSFLKSHSLFSQNYFGIPNDTTAQWIVTTVTANNSQLFCVTHYDYVYYISGDTIINNLHYHELSSHGIYYDVPISSSPCNNPQPVSYHQIDGYLRSDSGRVYFIRPATTSEALLYDFNLNVGDTLPQTAIHSGTTIVSSIDTFLIGNSYRRKFNLSGNTGSLNSTWIMEGVGHELGLIEPMNIIIDYTYVLNCYAERDTTFYTTGATCDYTLNVPGSSISNFHVDVFPNPAKEVFYMNFESEKAMNMEILITDLTGRKLSQQQIFITAGKNTREVPVDKISPGIYILSVESHDGPVYKKISIE